MNPFRQLALVLLAPMAVAGAANASVTHLYSYDPANDASRDAAGPVTLQVRQGLLSVTVVNLRSTVAQATADLRPADVRVLGGGGLAALVPAGGGERDLYEVQKADEGPQLVSALCPGASRAWLAFSRIGMDRDVQIAVIGAETGKPARLCRVLAYRFHGEWRAPATGPVLRYRDLPQGRFPGSGG
ncbi:MAG TPA: hypothetical protein VK801_11405 [Caulobacteraceae bacterium]|jgi:hypothetical protein|nr:hypothetical protein [Caulobacteraceae bacterium]